MANKQQLPSVQMESVLCDMLQQYCDDNGLPYKSADELLIDNMDNNEHFIWLSDYIRVWNAWESAL